MSFKNSCSKRKSKNLDEYPVKKSGYQVVCISDLSYFTRILTGCYVEANSRSKGILQQISSLNKLFQRIGFFKYPLTSVLLSPSSRPYFQSILIHKLTHVTTCCGRYRGF